MPNKQGTRTRAWPVVVAVSLLLLAGPAVALSAEAQSGGCERKGKEGECKEYGQMWMDRKATIEGEPVQLASEIYLNTNFHEMGARWVMFSIRNVTWDGSDPVWIEVERFASEHGDVVTTREDRSHNNVDLWVDVMDLPVETTITIEMTVGSTERGAFMLESIMVVFDRGYEEVYDSHGDAVDLFASTHLGVKKPTDGASSGLTSRFQNIPGPGIVAVVLATGLAAFAYTRRRYA